MSGYISDCIIASDLTPVLSACCWSWDDLTAVEDHTVWRGVDVFHQAGAKVVMCHSNHAASTVFPSCRNPVQSALRCVYILVQCLYHLRIPIFWYMTLLFQYVGMYILEELAAFIPWEDLFMDYPEYRGSKLLLNVGTYISINMILYVQKTESFSSPLWRSQISVLLYSKHCKIGCVSNLYIRCQLHNSRTDGLCG